MINFSTIARTIARAATPGVAALSLLATCSGVEAQWFSLGFGLRSDQVEREIAASGYRLTGPIERNGNVYLADVIGRGGDRERLVIDASSGKLLQRYRARQIGAAQPRYAAEDADGPAPRPPALVEGRRGADASTGSAGPARRATQQELARGEDPSQPLDALSPGGQPGDTEKTHRKASATKHRKPEPAPVEQPVALPAPAADAPAAEAPSPAIIIAPTPAPAAVAAPALTSPPRQGEPASPADSAAAPRVAQSRTGAAPEPAPAQPAKPRKPVLNDLPVDPLE